MDFAAEYTHVCKGIYARYTETQFTTKAGGWGQRSELRPLKRMSCTGCGSCYGILDSLSEFPDMLEFSEGVLSGDVVTFGWKVDSVDWETGIEDCHLVAYKHTGAA